ncbi:hypothetical protein KXV68_004810 [Aspergillus fumigatus]|nr:hypothetical protein KXX23_002953 [Aspergillus fumigatus]KAH1713991.1 hypothetical protein KXX25_005720 [Aspergillus fumigatus]KAH2155798.1 hypothetical protein KXV68_004810 [Aspergillus fumigatus]KAH2590102.1 hypothetical protein KXW93_005129 [Aspergillus fumigatus]KAH2733180.1 hypothetical protein KXW77_002941 [Aspergillus fumigatus]
MNLLDLPTEVLVMIAEALQTAHDINTLARTSRTLYSCINYVLYQSDVQNGNGKALIWAARRNKPATAQKSLQAGVKKLKKMASPAPDALVKGRPRSHDAVVIGRRCASVNLKKAPGHPLVIAASNNRKAVVKVLLEKGADSNARRDDSTTSLHIAVMRGCSDIVSMLLIKGADTDLGDNTGTTPLHTAVWKKHCKITQLLLERGAAVGSRDSYGRTALDIAMTHGSQRSLSLCLKHAKINAQDCQPLHPAISLNKTAVVRWLLENGADINRKDSRGQTPLLYAMLEAHDHLVELLLLYDVDPDAERYDGLTPLKLASEINREDWAQKLRAKRDKHKYRSHSLHSTS